MISKRNWKESKNDIISDAGPLIILSKVNKLDILRKLFLTTIITKEVKQEILVKEKPGFYKFNEAFRQGWLEVKKSKSATDYGLGKGENSAITIAKETKKPLLIDDLSGYNIAEALEVRTIRTGSIIILARKKKLMTSTEASSAIEDMIDEGYYISPRVYKRILKELKK